MQIRFLTPEDHAACMRLSSVTWLHSVDPEEPEENWPPVPTLGYFTDDGDLASIIEENPFSVMYDGAQVPYIGIGGVATKPEYRRIGSIRKLFTAMLQSAYEKGVVFSSLSPFSHEFYRKFGYEMSICQDNYTIEPDLLTALRGSLPLRRLEAGEGVRETMEIHNTFAKRYNLCSVRTPEQQKLHLGGDTYKEEINRFLIGDGAYVVYKAERDVKKHLQVLDWAVTEERYFPEILGLFGVYHPMLHTVGITVPHDIPVEAYVSTNKKLTHTIDSGHAARVVRVDKALALLQKPSGCRFTVKVTDPILPQNNGTWLADGYAASLCDEPADMECDVSALAPLLLGFYTLDTAAANGSVQIHHNAETLRSVFRTKPILITENY